jgi:hypothetical protein
MTQNNGLIITLSRNFFTIMLSVVFIVVTVSGAMLIMVILSVVMLSFYAECFYVDCCYAVIKLSVMLCVIMLSFIIVIVSTLRVFVLSVGNAWCHYAKCC